MNSTQHTGSWKILRNAMMVMMISGFLTVEITKPTQAQTQINFGDSAGWVQSLEDAVAQSQNTGKPIMFVFSGSDWCSYCQRLEQEVFQTPEFESWSNQNVIKVMVDFPRYHNLSANIAKQNEELKEYFGGLLRGYPTVLLVQTDGTVLGRSGFVAGGPIPWIAKTDPILRQSQQRLAGTSSQSH